MTLKCIAGIVKPDKGKIISNGTVFFDSEKKINLSPQKRKVGFLFQNYALFPHMSVKENIQLGIQNLSKEEKDEITSKYLKKFKLEGFENRYPWQLSCVTNSTFPSKSFNISHNSFSILLLRW